MMQASSDEEATRDLTPANQWLSARAFPCQENRDSAAAVRLDEVAFQNCWPSQTVAAMPLEGQSPLWRTVSTGVGNNAQTLRSIRLRTIEDTRTQGKYQFHSVPTLLSSTAFEEDEQQQHHCPSDATPDIQFYMGESYTSAATTTSSNQDKENHFRPVYVIRPNHHIFGCMSYEEEDPDEFFISSGCVRASCPNIYEATVKASTSYGWQSCAELEHLVDDTGQINSYQIDNYEMKVRNARLPRRNSEVSSTTTTTISPSNDFAFGDQCGRFSYNRHRSMAVGLPPLRLPYADDGQMQQREKALSLIVLAKSQGNSVERGWRRHKLGRMRRWNQPLRSLDASNLQWKSDTSSPAY